MERHAALTLANELARAHWPALSSSCVRVLLSALRGLDGGVKVLSEINMGLAMLLLAFVLLAGPTLLIVTGFFDYLLAYGEYLPALSNPFGREDVNFSQGWTSFYWAWWISWSSPAKAP